MSKMKKVISLVLCFAMLAGAFTFLGDLIAPSAEAAGTTNVTDYATLDAAYDKFVYLGIDVVEVANGELTDGYVNAGDWLEYRATILSDMYIGSSNPHIVYERDFFDVRVITSTTPSTSSTFEKADYEGNLKFADGKFMNADHPVAPQNNEVASYNTLTALPYSNVTTQLGFCGIDSKVYSNWDLVKSNLGVTSTVTNTNFEMKTDEWITSWYVRVKEGLADGDTGKSFSPVEIWKHQIGTQGKPGDSRRLGDISTGDSLGTYQSSQSLSLRASAVQHVLLDDTYHEFTIGKGAIATFTVDGKAYGDPVKALTGTDIAAPETNPSKDGFEFKGWALKGTTDILTFPQKMGEANVTYVAIFETVGGEDEEPTVPEVTKYEAAFLNLDGSPIAKAEYAEGEAIVAPEVENLLGWVDSTGKLVEVAATMGTKALTYTAVLTTDKFDVKVNIGEGAYAEDAVLPEGAYVEGGYLYLKAGLGEEVDLTAVPLPEREGYTASWAAETVKVESIKGANARINWTIETYTATFYVDKEAYDAGADAITSVAFPYGSVVPFSAAETGIAARKPEKKFVGWKNAETDEIADKTAKFADDVAFYAYWTDFDATVTVWGRDYENGGWKALTTKYADAGTTVKINDLKALVTEANYGTAAAQYVVAGYASTFSNDTAIRADFAMAEGNTDVYLFTSTKFETTFKTPVFGEDGIMVEGEYTSTTKSSTSSTDDTFLKASVLADTPAAYTGYEFIGWKDAEGNVYAPGTIALDYANGTTAEFTAEYKLVEYTIEFAIDNKSAIKEIFTVDRTFKLGDKFTLSSEIVIDENGDEAVLPEIGVENAEQAGGPYRNVDGYKFTGWKTGTQAANLVDYDITKEVTLTPDIIKSVTLNKTIQIKGFWEALSYDFVAYIAKSYNAEGEPDYEALPATSVLTGKSLDDAYAAAEEAAKANLPKGYRFLLWKLEDGSNKPNTMPAYGVEVYATYTPVSLSLYVDYNYGTKDAPVELEKTMSESNIGDDLFYGMDVVNDIPANEQLSIDMNVRALTITEATRPGATYEIVGWKVYYVTNKDDAYDKTKWNEGYNEDANSTIAKYTLIYQAQWMAHKDFFFRVVNTDGELRSAMDWKFQKYFWYNNKPATKETAVPLNHLPDRLLILGFFPMIEFEDGLSIRVEPITLSKAWLDPTNWGSLLKALFEGLSSGFGGELW